MNKLSMNTYIYAPKDDIKHRALWRQPYTKEEERRFLFGYSLKVLLQNTFLFRVCVQYTVINFLNLPVYVLCGPVICK